MTNEYKKKLVITLFFVAIFTGLQAVAAQTTGIPTSPYHVPTDTGVGIGFDNSLVIGATLYGVGVLLTGGAKVISAKVGGFKFLSRA